MLCHLPQALRIPLLLPPLLNHPILSQLPQALRIPLPLLLLPAPLKPLISFQPPQALLILQLQPLLNHPMLLQLSQYLKYHLHQMLAPVHPRLHREAAPAHQVHLHKLV